MYPISCFARLIAVTVVLTATAVNGADRTQQSYAFSRGAHGFLIAELNDRLVSILGAAAKSPKRQDVFDEITEHNLALFRQKIGLPAVSLSAGPTDFEKLQVPWPSDPARALQVIDTYEGTLFKLEGPDKSGDQTPMVTYGLVGFTSHDLSLQRFLFKANQQLNGKIIAKVGEKLGPDQQRMFKDLIAVGGATRTFSKSEIKQYNHQFVDWALTSPMGAPKKEIAVTFADFRNIPSFPSVQLELAKSKCWDDEAVGVYLPKAFPHKSSVSPKAMLFLLDMTVLSNGPGEAAWSRLKGKNFTTEEERMNQISSEMAVTPKYETIQREDIVEREQAIIKGRGLVHGEFLDLKAFAIVPTK